MGAPLIGVLMSIPKGIEFAGDPNFGKTAFPGPKMEARRNSWEPWRTLDKVLQDETSVEESSRPKIKRRIKLRD